MRGGNRYGFKQQSAAFLKTNKTTAFQKDGFQERLR